MLIEEISAYQIVTAILFIAILLAIQVFIIKNKNNLKAKWGTLKRIHVMDQTRLGPTEKVQIIKVDQTEYLYFFCKGSQPVIVPIARSNESFSDKTTKLESKRVHTDKTKSNRNNKLKARSLSENSSQTDSKIIEAISIARKQNPKVSFE